MATYLDQVLQKLKEFEGAVPWMYRDTAGRVTVGVGLMLPGVEDAERLRFTVSGRPATLEEVRSDFMRVDALPMGRPAEFYRRTGAPELAGDEMLSLLQAAVLALEQHLRSALPEYDSMPETARMALLDMGYNLGGNSLLNKFPRLMDAVRTRNWAAAARCCMRQGPGAERNLWTRQMFLASVLPVVRAMADSRWKQLGYGLVGIAVSVFRRRVPP